MEVTLILYCTLSLSFFLLSLHFFLRTKPNRTLNLPPTPANCFPIIGHLRLLKPPIHRTFASLSHKLGPIFSLQLGRRRLYVVSSLSIAEECFTKNDIVLANRPHFLVGKHVGYNYTTMFNASYGDLWRNLRRIGAVEIFSSHRLNSFLPLRKDEIQRLITRLSRDSLESFAKIEMRSVLADLTFNNIMRMIAGKRYYGDDLIEDEEASHVRKLITEVLAISGAGNPGDYICILDWLTNREKKVKQIAQRMDSFLQSLIDEHRRKMEESHTMIDHLLSLQKSQPQYYTDLIIKGLVLIMVLAGTETSATTLEWALSSLLNNPNVLNKAITEINHQIGDDRVMEESDISQLPYLQNVISENFRLNPSVPLLASHLSSEECNIGGYKMPSDTMLLVNAWDIHRDPNLWDEATRFKPERFEKEGEIKKLMPFGLGRRACPGESLARRMVGLTLGTLIQCFEWKRVNGEEIDMCEGKGLTMPKAIPLEAMCKARPIVSKISMEK